MSMRAEVAPSNLRIVKVPGSVILPLGKDSLVMVPSTGAWAILDEEAVSFYCSLDSEIFFTASQAEKLGKLLDGLQSAGLLYFGSEAYNRTCRRTNNPSFIPLTLVVMHLSNNCNFSCKYCQVSAGPKARKFMKLETARLIVDKLVEFPQTEFHVQFYGGEPLTSFSVIEKTVEYCKKEGQARGKKFHFLLQTNGSLIDNHKAHFFAEKEFKIGVSIDGPAFISNKLRISKDRDGSYSKTVGGMEILRRFGIHFGVIAVLTKLHVPHMEAVLNELCSLGVDEFKLNPMAYVGRGRTQASMGITSEEYFSCMQFVLSSITKARGEFRESNVKCLVSDIVFPFRTSVCHGAPCGAGTALLAFDTDGSMYPCDRFLGMPRWRISTSKKLKLLNIADARETSSVVEALFGRNLATIGDCKNCEWRAFCPYSCPAEQYAVTGDVNSVPFFCTFYKLMFPYLFHLIAEDQRVIRYVLGKTPGPNFLLL